tara:strand:+ start:12694 stop:13623 length:930 start_codon:yes stop_codon:yes gene_type:complete
MFTIQTFFFQYENNAIYRSYCDLINFSKADVSSIEQIPFLPIQFFKTHEVKSFRGAEEMTFSSSGTTGEKTSTHFIKSLKDYENSFNYAFRSFYGDPKEVTILALLPCYLERKGSSLIYMVENLIQQSQSADSGFYLNDYEKLKNVIEKLEATHQPTILIGVSFALLDLIEQFNFDLNHTLVMETGGMKGRRKELIREDLHKQLCKGFGVEQIHSEYGMTELLSQAYSKGHGVFSCPPWIRVSLREITDPFKSIENGGMGNINVIDLANQFSCAFIATQDIGKIHAENQFEILGRADYSDVRGCNLLVY